MLGRMQGMQQMQVVQRNAARAAVSTLAPPAPVPTPVAPTSASPGPDEPPVHGEGSAGGSSTARDDADGAPAAGEDRPEDRPEPPYSTEEQYP